MHLPEPSSFVEHRLCLREPTVDKFRMVPFIIKQTNKLIWSCLQGQGTNKLSSHVWSRNGFIRYLREAEQAAQEASGPAAIGTLMDL